MVLYSCFLVICCSILFLLAVLPRLIKKILSFSIKEEFGTIQFDVKSVTVLFFQGKHWVCVYVHQPLCIVSLANSDINKELVNSKEKYSTKVKRLQLEAAIIQFQRLEWILSQIIPIVCKIKFSVEKLKVIIKNPKFSSYISICLDSWNIKCQCGEIPDSIFPSNQYHFCCVSSFINLDIKLITESSFIQMFVVESLQIDFGYFMSKLNLKPQFGIKVKFLAHSEWELEDFKNKNITRDCLISSLISDNSHFRASDKYVSEKSQNLAPEDINLLTELPFNIFASVLVNYSAALTSDNTKIKLNFSDCVTSFNGGLTLEIIFIAPQANLLINEFECLRFDSSKLMLCIQTDVVTHLDFNFDIGAIQCNVAPLLIESRELDSLYQMLSRAVIVNEKSSKPCFSNLRILCVPVSFHIRIERTVIKFEQAISFPLLVLMVQEMNIESNRNTSLIFTSFTPMNLVNFSRSFSCEFELVSLLLIPINRFNYFQYISDLREGSCLKNLLLANREFGIIFLWDHSTVFVHNLLTFPDSNCSINSLIRGSSFQSLSVELHFNIVFNMGRFLFDIPYARLSHFISNLEKYSFRGYHSDSIDAKNTASQSHSLYRLNFDFKVELFCLGIHGCLSLPTIWPSISALNLISHMCHDVSDIVIFDDSNFVPCRELSLMVSEFGVEFKSKLLYIDCLDCNFLDLDIRFRKFLLNFKHELYLAKGCCPCYRDVIEELSSPRDFDQNSCIGLSICSLEGFKFILKTPEQSKDNFKHALTFDFVISDILINWSIPVYLDLMALKYYFSRKLAAFNSIFKRNPVAKYQETFHSPYFLRYSIANASLNLDFSSDLVPNLVIDFRSRCVTSVNFSNLLEPMYFRNDNICDLGKTPEWISLISTESISECLIQSVLLNTCFHNISLFLSTFQFLTADVFFLSFSKQYLREVPPFIDYSDLVSLGFCFDRLILCLCRNFNAMQYIDNIIDHWKAANSFEKSWYGLSNLLIEGLPIANLSFQAKSITVLFEEEIQMDSILRCKRILSLSERNFLRAQELREYFNNAESVREAIDLFRLRNSFHEYFGTEKTWNFYADALKLVKNVALLYFDNFDLRLNILSKFLTLESIQDFVVALDSIEFRKGDSSFDPKRNVELSNIDLSLLKESWVRHLSFTSDEICLRLRVLPIPVALTKKFVLCGDICGAAFKCTDYIQESLKSTFKFGTCRVSYLTEKIGAPLKLYYSFLLEIIQPIFSYGKSYDRAMHVFSLALNRISSLKSSESFDLWDNLRFKYHGKLACKVTNCEIKILSSPNISEYDHMVLSFDLNIEFSNHLFNFGIVNLLSGIRARSFGSFTDKKKFLVLRPVLRIPLVNCKVVLEWKNEEFYRKFFCPIGTHYLHIISKIHGNRFPLNYYIDSFRAKSLKVSVGLTICSSIPSIPSLILFDQPSILWFSKLLSLFSDPPDYLKVSPFVDKSPSRPFYQILEEVDLTVNCGSSKIELRHLQSLDEDTACLVILFDCLSCRSLLVNRQNGASEMNLVMCQSETSFDNFKSFIYSKKIQIKNCVKVLEIEYPENVAPINGRFPAKFVSAAKVSFISAIPTWFSHRNDSKNLIIESQSSLFSVNNQKSAILNQELGVANHIRSFTSTVASNFVAPTIIRALTSDADSEKNSRDKMQENQFDRFIVEELMLIWTADTKINFFEWLQILDYDVVERKKSDKGIDSSKDFFDEKTIFSPVISHSKSSSQEMNRLFLSNSKFDNFSESKSIKNDVSNNKCVLPSGQAYFPASKTVSRFSINEIDGTVKFNYDFNNCDIYDALNESCVTCDSTVSSVLFIIELISPQLNLYSDEISYAITITASSAKLSCSGFPLTFKLNKGKLQERFFKSVVFHKKEVSVALSKAEIYVADSCLFLPNNIIQNSVSYHRILEPSTFICTYGYDCDIESGLKRIFSNIPNGVSSYTKFISLYFTSLFSNEIILSEDEIFLMQLLNTLQSEVFSGYWKRAATSFIQCYIPSLYLKTCSEYFNTLIDVLDTVFLEEYEENLKDSKSNDANDVSVANREIYLDAALKARAKQPVKILHNLKVLEIGLGNASWLLMDNSCVFMEAYLTGIKFKMVLQPFGFKSILFTIQDGRLKSFQHNSSIDVVFPIEYLWSKRHVVRDKFVDVHAELWLPSIENSIQIAAQTEFWDLLEIKIFPIEIVISTAIYLPIRNFFFHDSVENESILSQIHDFVRDAGGFSVPKLKEVSCEKKISANSGDKFHLFKYMRIGDFEVVLSFQTLLFDINRVPLVTRPFVLNNQVISSSELISKLELQYAIDGLTSIPNRKDLLKKFYFDETQEHVTSQTAKFVNNLISKVTSFFELEVEERPVKEILFGRPN